VIDARRQPLDLPLVATLLCLYGAGWIGGIAGMLLGGGPASVATAQGRSWLVPMLVVQLVSAVVGAIAFRYLIRIMAGCEVRLGAAIAALVAGALVRTFGEYVLVPALDGFPDSAAPAAGLVWIALGLVATFVSYLVLQYAYSLRAAKRPLDPYLVPYSDVVPDEQSAPPSPEQTSYDECVDAVRETSAGLVEAASRAHRDEVAAVILNGLPYLEAATEALQRATPPAHVPLGLHRELIDGAAAAREELLTAAREAALGADSRLQLAGSEGMLETRQALHALAELGVACDW
jgi:hypothetical protein